MVLFLAALLKGVASQGNCGCSGSGGRCAKCQGNRPCLDLYQQPNHHHYMWLQDDGRAYIDGEASNHQDDREWRCDCVGSCDGLVGRWRCNGFYNNYVVIDSLSSPRPFYSQQGIVLSTEVCYGAASRPTARPTTMPPTAAASTTTVTTQTRTTATAFGPHVAQQMSIMRGEIEQSASVLRGEMSAMMASQTSALASQAARIAEVELTASSIRSGIVASLAAVDPLGSVETGGCTSGCLPAIEATGSQLKLRAAGGSVIMQTATCGEMDLCDLRHAVREIGSALSTMREV